MKNNECSSVYCNEELFKTGVCKIDDPITKTQWLTNIIIFENTNGNYTLYANQLSFGFTIFFETVSSNNKERIFYAMIYNEDKYIFKNENDSFVPYIKQKINSIENKELINPQIFFFYNNYQKFIYSIGSRNSNIELLIIEDDKKDLIVYNSSYFLNCTNRIIKGISSFVYIFNSEYLVYGTVTELENDPLNNYLTFYYYKLTYSQNIEHELIVQLQYSNDLGNTKGDFISCFNFDNRLGHISCFYLSNDNYYTIIGIENNMILLSFTVNNKTIIGSPSNKNNDNLYFLKGVNIGINKAIYCYYSGENDEIPTFLFKTIDKNDFSLSNLYTEFPVIYLNDTYYSFNNNIKYNDLTIINSEQFYFISTNKDNNFIIITHFQFYISDGHKLLIRYYTIKLQEYYNIKILNGLNSVNFNSESDHYLTLVLDFCFYDSYQSPDEIIHNSALIFLSYINRTYENNIDFIEYAFNNNKNYIIVNFTENFKIENNIFGYNISKIVIMDFTDREEIKYYHGITEEPWDLDNSYLLDPNHDLIKVNITNYSFDKIQINLNYKLIISPPIQIQDFNNYCDNYNDNFGNINDTTAYEKIKNKNSIYSNYDININEELSAECNDTNCTLCLRDNRYYCIVCKDNIYTIIYNNSYKNDKLKICTKDINITKESVNEIDTTINIESTNLNTSIISNINIESSIDYKVNSSHINDIKSSIYEELTNTEKVTNINNSDKIYISIISTSLESTNNDIFVDTDKNTEIIETTSSNIDTKKVTDISETDNKLLLEDLLNNKYKDLVLSDDQIKQLYEDIHNYIINKYDGNDTKINTSNVKIEISQLDSQQNSEFSNINLQTCRNILKDKYGDLLTMLKFDIIIENEKSTFVQYEIYDQTSKKILELKECSGNNVIINVPINLEPTIESLYNMLSKYGYNLFDANDPFYNDICAIYTTENETDILLYDRRMDIYSSTLNISLCQEGCKFIYYNSKTKKAECDCPLQQKSINTNLNTSEFKFNHNKMIAKFYEYFQNSNFKVLNCFKLVFHKIIFVKNIGSIIMTIFKGIMIILTLIFILKDFKKINFYIQDIIKNKIINNENNNNNSNNYIKKEKLYKAKKKKLSNTRKMRNFYKRKTKKTQTDNINFKNAPPKKRNIKKQKTYSISRNFTSNSNKFNLIDNNYNSFNEFIKNKKIEKKENIYNINGININIFNNNKSNKRIFFYKNKKSRSDRKLNSIKLKKCEYNKNWRINNYSKNKINNSNNNSSIIELNDYEMNMLKYEKAIKLDKRSYFQYYISLLKKNHIIIFTFFPTNDYNLMTLKILLFLVSFSLFLNFNAFFFNDDTMHKIYKNNGEYIFMDQIIHIIYSSIIPSIINILLKILALSEKDILKIKKEEDMKNIINKAQVIEKCLKIKFSFFFIISFLLMAFFWYFISCFCAVYNNTQKILFKDTIISFCLSLIYPFGIYLIPGLLRIPSLRAEKKDKLCLYALSQLISII